MALAPWLEANEGLFSLTLSIAALGAAFGLAWLEHQRAKVAETARTREPAAAALALIDELTATLERAKETEAVWHEARRYARRAHEPLLCIARAPTTSAPLILALHGAAVSFSGLADNVHVAAEDDGRRRAACAAHLKELTSLRAEIAKHVT